MEVALTKSVSIMSEEEYEFLDLLLTESGRPVTWLALLNRDDMPEACQDTLRQAAPLIRRGGVPQVTCRPLIIQIKLRNPFIFANLASWNPVFNQPKEVQEKIYRDTSFRNAFREALKKPDIFSGKWERLEVKEVFTPSMKPLEGRTVADIAKRARQGRRRYLPRPRARRRSANPVHDGAVQRQRGAHSGTDQRSAHDGRTVRRRRARRYAVRRGLRDLPARHVGARAQAMTLERAIQRITSEPADYFGIKGRGRLVAGDGGRRRDLRLQYRRFGARGEMRNDLPGGGRRLVMPARGIEYTVVNGEVLYEHGKVSGATAGPGAALRN